jgi:hypothetical protein
MKRAMVDFNRLLQIANLVVGALLVFAFMRQEESPYLDTQSYLLGLLLVAQTQVALMVEARHRDPFVQLLAFGNIFYFSLRLFTLAMYPVSAVFDRIRYEAADSDFALVYILLANLFLYVGLFVVRLKPDPTIDAGDRRPSSPAAVLVLLAATVAITYLGGRGGGGDAPRAVTAFAVLLAPLMIVSMGMTYWMIFKRTLSRGFAIALGGLILIEIVAHTLWGSRSAIVGFVQAYLLVSFAVRGRVAFSRKLVLGGLLMAPVMGLLLVAAFALSTYNRSAQDAGESVDVGEAITAAQRANDQYGAATDLLIGAVFARAGFFDFSAELIANRDVYSAVVNLPAYARSLIDNVATPGFDVFDQPKIANAIPFVYRDWGSPSKESVAEGGAYQSEQIGVYGEFYVLFGYASLPLFFVLGAGIKRLYSRLHDSNPYLLGMKRVIVFTLFVRTIDSFGFDWTVGETLPLVVATFLYAALFASRHRPRPAPEPPAAGVV